jgi:hypothetical protein
MQQLWFDQTAGAIVNQDLLGLIRQSRQAQTYRILAGVTPHDPDHWCQRRSGRCTLADLRHQGRNRFRIDRLTHYTDPADSPTGEGRLQGPCQQRATSQGKQQFVAVRPHTPATAGCRNQQMHRISNLGSKPLGFFSIQSGGGPIHRPAEARCALYF